jgi:hypothetical protein
MALTCRLLNTTCDQVTAKSVAFIVFFILLSRGVQAFSSFKERGVQNERLGPTATRPEFLETLVTNINPASKPASQQ